MPGASVRWAGRDLTLWAMALGAVLPSPASQWSRSRPGTAARGPRFSHPHGPGGATGYEDWPAASVQRPTLLPSGSAKTANQPMDGISVLGTSVLPPSDSAVARLASMSSVDTETTTSPGF